MKDREITREFLRKDYHTVSINHDRVVWFNKGYWYEVNLNRGTIQQTKPERDKVHAYAEVGTEYIHAVVD